MGKSLVDIFRPEIEQWANERAEEIATEMAEKIANERAEKIANKRAEKIANERAESRLNEETAKKHLTDLYTYVQKGGMTIDFAAGEASMSREEFLKNMESAGFKVPQPTA